MANDVALSAQPRTKSCGGSPGPRTLRLNVAQKTSHGEGRSDAIDAELIETACLEKDRVDAEDE